MHFNEASFIFAEKLKNGIWALNRMRKWFRVGLFLFLPVNISNFQVNKVNWFSLISTDLMHVPNDDKILWEMTAMKKLEEEKKSHRICLQMNWWRYLDGVYSHAHRWAGNKQPSPFSADQNQCWWKCQRRKTNTLTHLLGIRKKR